jgi:diphthamide biosynthesis enzyme Dph1/Dph2-like protein
MVLELNFELEKLFLKIEQKKEKNEDYEKILIQLPDGLKPKAKEIQEKIQDKFPKVKITFWAGDCFGACDTPNVNGFDIFVAFGHSVWKY